jgi:signal transduction histidine kinase
MFKKLLGERNYFFRRYLLIINFWAILCSTFGFLFIFSRVNLTGDEAKIYFLSWLAATIIIAIIASLLYGGLRLLFGINIEHKDAFIVNSFILNSHVDSKISDDDLKELFYQLKKEGITGFKNAVFYASLVAIFSIIPMIFIKTSVYNLTIILIGDVLSVVILALFTRFSSEGFSAVFLRECREMMRVRGIKSDENIQLFTLKSAFYYFIFLFILMIVIVLSFIPNPTPYLLGLIFIGFIFIILIVRMIFSSISSIFQEVDVFMSRLSKEEKVSYFTESSYKEALELSESLTESAIKVYDARVMEKKARQDLAELDESKTQFILATEHHLRTPLTIVKGYVGTLLEKKSLILDEESKSYLNKVKDATNRVTDLVNELLEISQMEVGKSILKLESVNIKDLITGIINNSKSDIDIKQIKTIFLFPEKPEENTLNINKEKMTEALSNLISNAIKYNKTGGELRITGKIITNESNKKFYQISVEDQGIGIKPENLSKIFTQYFERGEEARKVYATGRGIGLVIVKNIVKAHQGTIRVESDGEGKGARFIVELPMQ